jgi:hypothetical protein
VPVPFFNTLLTPASVEPTLLAFTNCKSCAGIGDANSDLQDALGDTAEMQAGFRKPAQEFAREDEQAERLPEAAEWLNSGQPQWLPGCHSRKEEHLADETRSR